MDDVKRFENKLDKVVTDIGTINVTLSAQKVTLDEHIRRTNLLEEKIAPIEKHVYMIQGALKLIIMVGGLVGLIEFILHKVI